MRYRRPTETKDLREAGRIILAHGESTGHQHEVMGPDTDQIPPAQFFEEPSGRRVLLVERPCVLTHQEHGSITLDPAHPQQVRQGDVLLTPIGDGAWEVTRQREYFPDAIRTVAD